LRRPRRDLVCAKNFPIFANFHRVQGLTEADIEVRGSGRGALGRSRGHGEGSAQLYEVGLPCACDRQVAVKRRVASVQPGLDDGLRCADTAEFGRPIGG
jgi:hypothetical protein